MRNPPQSRPVPEKKRNTLFGSILVDHRKRQEMRNGILGVSEVDSGKVSLDWVFCLKPLLTVWNGKNKKRILNA